MDKNADQVFSELKEEILGYVNLKFRLLKLIAIERIAQGVAVLSHGIAIGVLAFFLIFFLFSALGFWLGELLESAALGFLIVGGIWLVLLVITLLCKKGIREGIMNMVINAMRAKDDKDDEKSKTNDTPGTTHE